jgi:hypothetical protein
MTRTKRPAEPVGGRELVEQNWGYDGPHSPGAVIEAARAMDQLARYLGNATGPGNGKTTLPHGAAVYTVLGALHSAIYSLDQVLDQLAQAERRAGDDPKSYHDDRKTPASTAAAEAAREIEAARTLLVRDFLDPRPERPTVCGHLQAAHSAASHLGYNG